MATIEPYSETTTLFEEYNVISNVTTSSNRTKSCPPSYMTPEQIHDLNQKIALLAVEFALAMFGNLCILLALWRRRRKSSRMSLFILHLAIADIIVALFLIFPVLLIRVTCGFRSNDAICKFYKFMQVAGMLGSTFVLLAAAFDRYKAVRFPMQSFRSSKKRVHITVAIAWGLAALFSLPQLFVYKKQGFYCDLAVNGTVDEATFLKGYTLWYLLVVLVIPAVLLTYFYGMIAYMIMKNAKSKSRAAKHHTSSAEEDAALTKEGGKSGKEKKNFAPRASSTAGISRAKVKTVKMTLVIVLTYLVCWAPFFTVEVLKAWGLHGSGIGVPWVYIQFLAGLNSCTNPWIYMCFTRNLCGDLQDIICCVEQEPKTFKQRNTNNQSNNSRYQTHTSHDHTEHTISFTIESPVVCKRFTNIDRIELSEKSSSEKFS